MYRICLLIRNTSLVLSFRCYIKKKRQRQSDEKSNRAYALNFFANVYLTKRKISISCFIKKENIDRNSQKWYVKLGIIANISAFTFFLFFAFFDIVISLYLRKYTFHWKFFPYFPSKSFTLHKLSAYLRCK